MRQSSILRSFRNLFSERKVQQISPVTGAKRTLPIPITKKNSLSILALVLLMQAQAVPTTLAERSSIKLTIEEYAPSADPVVVGAGDIGYCSGNGDETTATLLDNIPGTVITIGDNAYEN